MADALHEHWAAGDAYEQFMGRWSWEIASRFLAWLNLAPNLRWLDIGCGTGALTRAIATHAEPALVVGLDPSHDFVKYARQRTIEASFLAANGDALAIMDAGFDTVVSGLALNFMPRPEFALREMRRIVRPGGRVAAYVWDYAGKMEFLRCFWDAAAKLDANATTLHEGYRFPICQPEPLYELWQRAGFHDVSVDALDIATLFDDFERYWHPFTVGNFPAPKYTMSLEETQRTTLRDNLRATIPTASDGSIHLIARVWAVRGFR